MTKVNFHQKAIVYNQEHKFLVLKAAYKGLKWDLPGGAVDIPEEHEPALRRELREEAGIEIDNLVPLAVETGFNQEDDTYVLFIGYRCTAITTTVTLSSEHTEFRWVTKEEFVQLDATPYLQDFVKIAYRGMH